MRAGGYEFLNGGTGIWHRHGQVYGLQTSGFLLIPQHDQLR
jgi:hypothetical protein